MYLINGLIDIINRYESNDNYIFTPIQVLAYIDELNTFDLIEKSDAKNIINQRQIIPYINSICYYFEEKNIDHDRAINIIKSIYRFRNECNNIDQLKDFIDNIPELKDLDYTLFVKIIICAIYRQHKTKMIKTIGNYLKDN